LNSAEFCAVGKLYEMKYGIPEDEINVAKKIVFDMENPFEEKTRNPSGSPEAL